MGIFINKGNEGFRQIRNSEYVDKSGLIAVVNGTLFTEKKLSCVTRCRRFGKSMAANIEQIKARHYTDKVAEAEYLNSTNRVKPCKTDADILLVGISYDAETKQHTCTIERWDLPHGGEQLF